MTNSNRSVYHRAKLLSSIFPWLLFNGVFPAATTAVPVPAPSILPGASSTRKRLRGHNQNQNNARHDGARHYNAHQNGRRTARQVQNYCGKTWTDANSNCLRPCPDGDAVVCDWGEDCFADLTSCPSLTVLEGVESGLPPPQPASLGGGLSGGSGDGGGGGTATGGGWGDTLAGVGGDGGSTTPASTGELSTGGDTSYTSPGGSGGGDSPTGSSSSSGGTTPFQVGATVPSSCPTTTNSINVGYYQSWAKYRSSTCHPQTASQIDINSFGYTHLIYSFAGISAAGEIQPYNGIMDEVTLYNEFNALKGSITNDAGGLVTLIAVGGWNLDQSLFSRAASSPSARQTFAQSVVRFVQEYNFDGIDLDWEYPVTRQGVAADYDNYPLLVQAIREALDTASAVRGKEYLLTMAIPVNPQKLEEGFNLRELSKYIHWFHLMSYDVHGAWDDVAGSNTDMEYISNAIENTILGKGGVTGDQLVFGMAAYGRSVTLTDPSCTTVGCPISGAGMEGCSGEAGFSPYFELKEQYIDSRRYTSLLVNPLTKSMEMILEGGVFVSLDVEDTFGMKRDYYLSKCFRGQMWWAIDMIKTPPFSGGASTQASSFLDNNNSSPSVTPPAFVAAEPVAIPLSNAPGVTQDDAFCADTSGSILAPIKDCLGFVFCSNGIMTGSTTMCSPGLIFDANMGICNWPTDTNLCGFEFCPNKMSGYVPFEECSKFYYCKVGKVDGDIDVCPEGTLFDAESGICNWASEVICATAQPTMPPVSTPVSTPALAAKEDVFVPNTARPTYGTVAGTPALANEDASVVSNTERPTYGTVAGAFAASKPVTPPNASVLGASGASTSFQDQTAKLHFLPTDDAYVQENQPYQNYNDRFIVVDEDQRYDGLLRFYVQGLEGRNIEYVKLRLYVSNQSMFGGNFYKSKHNWHEDVVTWDNVPSIIGNKPLAVVNAALLDEWIEVDVTGLVDEDGPVSIRITSDSSDNVMYSSKENDNGNAPELIVGVEPATALAGAALGDIVPRDAPTVTNTFKIGPTDDAFVFRSTATTNYGDHVDLKVDMDNGYKRTYLRFDFSNVHIDSVKSAMLRLYATDSSPSGGMFMTVTNSNWDEETITFDNSPTPDGMNLGILEHVTLGNWYELDITDALTESGPLTICIMGNHHDKVMYSSKEGPHSPEIALTLEEYVPLSTRGTQVMEFEPTDDATIVMQAPNSNFGKTNEELKTNMRANVMQHFLLRFDVSNVPMGEVKSAILRLYAINTEPAFGGMFVKTRRTNWDERTVAWNNAPDADGRVMGSLMEVEYGSWYDLDVTSAVIGGSAVSFRASSPTFNEAIYASKESYNKPRLIVQYSPPEPIPEDLDVYIPIADSSILMDKPDDNFGRNEELKVDGHGGIYNSLLMFDLSSVEKGSVEKAILRLYAVDGSPSGGTFIVSQSTDWSNHKVTWNTAPRADGVILETLDEVIPYQWYDIDLAKIVNDLGGERLSIRIAPSHGYRCAYSSSRDRLGHLPQLLIKSDMFKGMG